MKKILFMMSLCALAFISCQKEELVDTNPFEGKYSYTFTVNHTAESKATIGDKDGAKWPVLWSEGDQLGVYGDGELLGVATIDAASAGNNSGTFTLNTDVELSNGDELYFSYPYVADAQMKTGKVAAEHTLTASGIGANAVAYAYVDYAGANTEFTLTHVNAYLKFNLSSSEFAGYTLQGVTLWAAGAELSGDVEVGNGDAVTYKGTGDYVKTTLATPTEMGTTAQSVYLSALPGNLSDKTVYAIVHMTKGIETVTLPVKLGGAGNLSAGTVTEITIPALTKSLAPKWYEPVETRYIAANGEGWSYGPENTVIFTSRTESQNVELKARGNFMKVKEPKYVKIKYMNGLDECYVNDNDQSKHSHIKINDVRFNYDKTGDEGFVEVPIKDDYTIDVVLNVIRSVTGSGTIGYIAGIEIKDVDKKTIWGTNLWLALKELKTIQYANGEILNRNLGVDEEGNLGTWRAAGSLFQWGRPFAIQSQANAYSKKYFTSAEATAVTSLDVSAENPYTLYYYAQGADYKDWYYGTGSTGRENDLDDLWGNPNGGWTAKGVKSIYDPCPKGWMVVSPAVIKEVIDAYESGEATFTGGTYPYVSYKGAHWMYTGGYTCDGYSGGFNWKKAGQLFGYWSNTNHLNHGYARCMYSTTYASAPEKFDTQFSKARAFPIRCMKDTENR